ncbi:MAG: hypothetical protein GY941_18425 [Planctomycetes bacterium]|nr:hypothetical protein [Planctomycetota bacterium]
MSSENSNSVYQELVTKIEKQNAANQNRLKETVEKLKISKKTLKDRNAAIVELNTELKKQEADNEEYEKNIEEFRKAIIKLAENSKNTSGDVLIQSVLVDQRVEWDPSKGPGFKTTLISLAIDLAEAERDRTSTEIDFLKKVISNGEKQKSIFSEAMTNLTEANGDYKDFPEFLKEFCDLRLISAFDINQKQELINKFKATFESNKKTCVVLIVDITTNETTEWTIAGFNDEEEFKTLLIDDANDALAIELKKKVRNRKKIIDLATLYLGRKLKEYFSEDQKIANTILKVLDQYHAASDADARLIQYSNIQAILEVIGNMAIVDNIYIPELEELEQELASLEHSRSIQLSKTNARVREAIISRGLESLAIYHAGGIKPEEIARFVYAASLVAAVLGND